MARRRRPSWPRCLLVAGGRCKVSDHPSYLRKYLDKESQITRKIVRAPRIGNNPLRSDIFLKSPNLRA
jgi:hypothetical protein